MKPNMSELFEKLNDLKTLFHYGQKLIPIIQSLIDFMGETVPLLENINKSIAESTSKIPKATNQINNVTSATEMATTEILDIVDVISNDMYKSEQLVKIAEDNNAKRQEIIAKLKSSTAGADIAGLVNELESIDDFTTAIKPLSETFDKVKNDAYSITLSLQVQDITAQQLAAVNHLIQSVQEKLSSLISEFNEADIKQTELKSFEVSSNAAFNPEARYDKDTGKQILADELVTNKFNTTSQEEIDKLFS